MDGKLNNHPLVKQVMSFGEIYLKLSFKIAEEAATQLEVISVYYINHNKYQPADLRLSRHLCPLH
jgi:hypothetical protein